MARCSILHKIKSLNPISLLCKGEELCLQQLFVIIPSDCWFEEIKVDFDMEILGFSVPQNR